MPAGGAAAWLGFFVYGASALLVQLILLSELAITFAGQELFLGCSLASWLGWVGAGSWAARRGAAGCPAIMAAAFVPLILANLLAIRGAKALFAVGQIVGVIPMLFATLMLLAPAGLAAGAAFTFGCRMAKDRLSPGRAYAAETLGAAAGGAIFTAWLAGHATADQVAALLAIPAAIAAAILAGKARVPRLTIAAATLAVAAIWVWSPVPRWTRAIQWRGYTFVAEHPSRYAHLALAKIGSITTFFQDGAPAAHFPDPAAYEDLAHWPLLTHPEPRRCLVIGTAATGTLAEILKHPVDSIDYVEIDSAVLPFLRPALPLADQEALGDPRVRVIPRDGRWWLAHSPDRYDVILLQLPGPSNAKMNRLYTFEAFRAAKARLSEGGIFAFTAPSSENYLSAETAYFNACLYRTLSSVFPAIGILPGDPLLFIASGQPYPLSLQTLAARYQERALDNLLVVPSAFSYKLDPARRQALLSELSEIRGVPINRDLFPVCYVFTWRLWLSKFASSATFLGAILLAAFAAWLARAAWRRRAVWRARRREAALAILGGASLIYETLLLLAFQSANGYLYWHLGALFAAFMLGMAAGAALFAALGPQRMPAAAAGRALRALVAAAGAEGILIAVLLPRITPSAAIEPVIPVALLLFVTGLLPGLAFPISVRLSKSSAPEAGALYAADLWGASFGAVIASVVLIPVAGLTAIAAVVGLAAIAAAAAGRPPSRVPNPGYLRPVSGA